VSLLLLYRASRPHVAVLGEVPGARGQYVDAIRMHAAEPGTRAVVLDAETVPFVDVSAARQ
jgi:anti-anti-sigma regulatory factor